VLRRTNSRKLVAVALLLAMVCPAVAQRSSKRPARRKPSKPATAVVSDPGLSAVDAVVRKAIANREIPGAVVVIGHNGSIIYRKAFGYRSLEPAQEPMTLDTIFDLASLTKCLATGLAVMRLVQNGDVRLNDPLAKYVPEFGRNGKEEITIRQLLTHYSGLRPDLDLSTPWQGYDEAMRRIYDEKPLYPPGSRFLYSDINFEVLGELVRRVAALPLEKYVDAHFYQVLHLQYTRFNPPAEWRPLIAPTQYENADLRTPVGSVAHGDSRGEMLRGIVHDPTARRMGGVSGHAGLFSNAADITALAQALLKNDGTLLSPAIITKMSTPQQPAGATEVRGLAWDLDSVFASNRGELLPVGSYGHTGFTGTSLWLDPSSQTFILILANAVHPAGRGTAVSLRAKIATAVAARLQLTSGDQEQAQLASITGYNETLVNVRRMAARNGAVLNGIDVLEADGFKQLASGSRRAGSGDRVIGVLTNHTGVDVQGRRTIDVLAHASGLKLAAIFSPEHGITGALDTTAAGGSVDAATGAPVYSVYGAGDAARRPSLEVLRKLDAVVVDIQDVGVRFYTYETTLGYFLEAAAKTGTEIVVLDRPDPIGGMQVQGPLSQPGQESFVNYMPEPLRHGMTMGELAQFFNGERKLNAKLTVVPMQGWLRGDWFDSVSQMWIAPSPNLRSLTQATLYPGVALVEYTNVSVGRGTDTPFELLGAPWIKAREFADYLNARNIAGVRFVPTTFTPTSSRYANQTCSGVQIYLADRYALDSGWLGVELAAALHKLYPADWQMQKLIELLGNQAVYDAIARGDDPRFIAEQWRDELEKFRELRRKYLLYPEK
jgi:uncharacterized protein YbbC (DUF1343 family)/CubicO group peptidase (beta-lactamase class C family)